MDRREGLAIGHMVTLAKVFKSIPKLQLDVSNIIENTVETLEELQSHGFNVCALQARLRDLLSSKVEVGMLNVELEKKEKAMERCNLEKSPFVEKVDLFEAERQQLQMEIQQCLSKKQNLEVLLKELQVEIKDTEVALEKTEVSLKVKEDALKVREDSLKVARQNVEVADEAARNIQTNIDTLSNKILKTEEAFDKLAAALLQQPQV